MAMGITMLAGAVFEAASDTAIAAPVNRMVRASVECAGRTVVIPSPIACANPVENVSSPSASPPSYSSAIPRSIFTASSQVKVNWRVRQRGVGDAAIHAVHEHRARQHEPANEQEDDRIGERRLNRSSAGENASAASMAS